MGNAQTARTVNFEDIQKVVSSPDAYLLINTLQEKEQNCLIKSTLNSNEVEALINKYMTAGQSDICIVVYGRNTHDTSVDKKYMQLLSLGFYRVYTYPGGMFEWLLLQDIYGNVEFPTTSRHLDLLKYKPNSVFNVGKTKFIEN